ncbi:unnamed protein product [Bursaphelenchus xylophilus]|uniref:(pine wood nematode) hypothetical protein n=1 Tax=Bursaphelenchus xylophilus TaxID=6326 RepID=A0A1I7S3I7_BURXY|nr:unnamed protein product [Bursaphelenchus xylophilus]CAG9116336.1 unnamed protein product [Bursaphelenchus xylophilus]
MAADLVDMTLQVSGESKAVIVYNEDEINNKAVVIEGCSDSGFYLLGVPKSVTIEKCNRCLIVIPACKGSIFYRSSNNGTIFACCQQFRAKQSDFLFYGFVSTDPIIENCNAVFQEITSVISGMDEWLHKAGLAGKPNKTKQVRDFTPEVSELIVNDAAQVPTDSYLPSMYHDECRQLEKDKGICLVKDNG